MGDNESTNVSIFGYSRDQSQEPSISNVCRAEGDTQPDYDLYITSNSMLKISLGRSQSVNNLVIGQMKQI